MSTLFFVQAARKHDIPYPTFVLYANRVHNMLGPSVLNGLTGPGDIPLHVNNGKDQSVGRQVP